MSQPQPTNNQPPNTNTNNNQNTNANPQPSTTLTRIPASAPAGLLTITQPPQTATSYYKIAPSNLVTFGWNFSYVLVTPSALTVSAVCDNGNTYPVGPTDGVIPGTATEVVWDLFSYQQHNPNTPLAQATYTLNIYDQRGPGAGRAPGHLQANTGLKFALYSPQAYTGLADGWTCTTCNAAWATYAANPVLVSVFATFLIMLLSGFGLLRHWR
ncbi:hypothetical protein D9615_004933 [Tricholomella constricta]|uniref:DUF7137 domain-containing protein n=1 Tax=Tricholomella constricta TaxID=117010 RepID=A0A8H5M739_9AGAR|nr:hypothetical protein D9615_004933 [Tricholomella constricta]